MNIGRQILLASIAVVATTCITSATFATGTLIRWHQMGEYEGGTNGGSVSTGYDTPIAGDQFDLSAINTPTYRTISGRPDGAGGIGVEFDSAQQEYMTGAALDWPAASPWARTESGFYYLSGIDDRGLQFWVRPTSTSTQTLVMDTNDHGVRINSAGKFSMRYFVADYDSTISATANTWYHIELVRPAGVDSRSRLYINGVAAAVSAPVDYHPSLTDTNMIVGANTAGDNEFFKGIIDDVRMYVYGTSTDLHHETSYGTWNFATDNGYAASSVTGLKGVAGDVTHDGFLNAADKTAFIAGWMHKRVVNGFQLGDMLSHSEGDLNFDGITNIQDLLVMQNALSGAGVGTISAAELSGVPEPMSGLLSMLAMLPLVFIRHRRGRA
jgi:Concanavalin A-like lectin/glucanases superfamily